MGEVMRPQPQVVENLFKDDYFQSLQKSLTGDAKTLGRYDSGFGRYCFGDSNSPILREAFVKSVSTARRVFQSKTLVPSYALFAYYEAQEGSTPSLIPHRDDNACTYTLDACIYQTEPWDLYVEDVPYTLHPNQALAYYGNDQEHWRRDFPNPESQVVAMVFFHYVETDHWFYSKGRDYVKVERNTISEEQWLINRQK